MTQKEEILQYIKEHGSITPMGAFYDLGITKLSTRVGEMRKKGIEFEIVIEKRRNKYNTRTVRYARYSLRKEETDEQAY
jgi:hypothetical protein